MRLVRLCQILEEEIVVYMPRAKKRTALLRKLKLIFRSYRSQPVGELERKRRTSVPKQSLRKRNVADSYNRTAVETTAAMLLIPKSAGVLANHLFALIAAILHRKDRAAFFLLLLAGALVLASSLVTIFVNVPINMCALLGTPTRYL